MEPRRRERISVEAMRLLESYDWPGNVRELENVDRARRSRCRTRETHHRPRPAGATCSAARPSPPGRSSSSPSEGLDLEAYLEGIRAQLMQQALERTGGVQTQAAELLGMSFRSFRYYAKKLGISADDGLD